MNEMNAMKLRCWMQCRLLLRRCRLALKGRAARRAAPACTATTCAAEDHEENAPRACGWFDSSHDLQQGLCVQEHVSADSLARELPLGAWLDVQLSGWRSAPLAAAPVFTPAR